MLRRPLGDDAPPARSTLGPEVHDPVGLGHHVEIVLDDDDGVARIHQSVQHPHELLDVGHVQPDGRLVEHVERALPGPQSRELRDELDALRLAARQRRTLLPKREVSEPDVLQQRECVVDARVRREEPDGIVHAHRQHVADVAAAILDCQRLAVEPLPAARIAKHLHVRQEAHLDRLYALPFAGIAASTCRVEREARRTEAAHARLGGRGEELADLVPEPHVGRGTGARCTADRRLVHLEHPRHLLDSGDARTSHPARRAAAPAFRSGPEAQVGEQHVAGERRLARSGDSRHDREAP